MTLQKLLKRYGITSVWHFTDMGNLESIEQHGLASLAYLKEHHIKVPHYGANSYSHALDERYGLDKYVHLAFTNDHPMYYKAKYRGSIKNGIWLEFSVEEILSEDVLFCDAVANARHSNIFNQYEVANNIDFETLLNGTDFESRKEARKAEILVPLRIKAKKIIGVSYGK